MARISGVKVVKFEDREAWKLWRLPRFTGSKLKDIITKKTTGELNFDPKKAKIGIYESVAAKIIGSAKLAEDEDPEKAMERGTRLEPIAIERFKQETGKKAVWCNDDLGWERLEEGRIAVSPDAVIGISEAVEVKCLSAARHLQAIDSGEVPLDSSGGKSYWLQALQYFVVNDSLKTLYFVLYDDRFPKGLDYFCIEIKRKDVKEEVAALLEHQRQWLKVVREKTISLSERVVPVEYSVQEPVETEFPSMESVSNEEALDRMYQNIKANS